MISEQFTCNLTTPELQQQKANIIKELKKLIIDKTELADGFSYRFNLDDRNLDLVFDFVKTERLCCPFFRFDTIVSSQELRLSLTGASGIKDFLIAELGM